MTRSLRAGVLLVALATMSTLARADKYELQWSMRPLAGVAGWREETTSGPAFAAVGGSTLGVSYGVTNGLDLGAEISVVGTTLATFKGSTIVYDGSLPLGDGLQRRTFGAYLLLGPTWRRGYDWVRVLTVSGGGGVRARSEGEFTGTHVRPMEKRAESAVDFAGLVRVGLERRLQRRLTVGGYLSALTAWGPDSPLMSSLSASFGVSYVYYP
jgi:hypothetical protein